MKKSSSGKNVLMVVGALVVAGAAFGIFKFFNHPFKFAVGQQVTCLAADTYFGNPSGTVYTIDRRQAADPMSGMSSNWYYFVPIDSNPNYATYSVPEVSLVAAT
jgi:hypothetical protein